MNRYAFLGHYLGLEHCYRMLGWLGPFMRLLPIAIQKELIRRLPPYVLLSLGPLESPAGAVVEGCAIVAPLLPEFIATDGEAVVLRKVLRAARLAEKLGASIISLGGFTSVVGNEGKEISEGLSAKVTSGNTYTAALVLQGMRRAAAWMRIQWNRSVVAIIGATGDIGSGCARTLAQEVGSLVLAARNEEKLESFALELRGQGSCEVRVVKYVKDAVRNADLILTATSAITTLIEAEDVKPGAVICDVAMPHNVAIDIVRKRNDVFVFEGGMARLPQRLMTHQRGLEHISKDGLEVFGCLAESIMLAFENRLEAFSLGRGNITPERILTIEAIAKRHGFDLAEFRYANVTFNEAHTAAVRENAARLISERA